MLVYLLLLRPIFIVYYREVYILCWVAVRELDTVLEVHDLGLLTAFQSYSKPYYVRPSVCTTKGKCDFLGSYLRYKDQVLQNIKMT